MGIISRVVAHTCSCDSMLRLALFLGSAIVVASLPVSPQSGSIRGKPIEEEELEQRLEELLDHSNITPEELTSLLNDDLDPEEVEYKVEAVDDGLVISIQEKQALFYPDLDYAEGSSEEVFLDAEEQMGDEEDLKSDVGDTVEVADLLQEALVEIEEEENDVEYDYSFLEAADAIVVLGEDAEELEYQEVDENNEDDEDVSEINALINKIEFDEAVKFDHFNGDRKTFEIVIMSGIALTCLMLIFGLATLVASFLRPRTIPTSLTIAPLPKPSQTTSSSGGIIRQYTRVPVEIKNMLPSNVAYKQLYDI